MNIDPNKLNLVAERLGYVAMRLEGVEALAEPTARADDWDGSKHPRGPDGKFVSMGGGGGSAKLHDALDSYVGGLKGKKGSTAALIKHLLQNEVPENEIFAAAKHMYGLTDDKKGYVSWYHKDMKKNGIAVPDIVKGGDHLSELASKTSTAEPLAEPKVEPEVAKALEAKSEGGLGGDHVGEIPKTPVPKHDSYAASKMYNIATQEGTTLDEKIQKLEAMTGYTGKDGDYQAAALKFLKDAKGEATKVEELPAEDAPDMLPEPQTDAQKSIKGVLENALTNGPGSSFGPEHFVQDYENYKLDNPESQAYLTKAVAVAKAAMKQTAATSVEPLPESTDPLDQLPMPANDGQTDIKEDFAYSLDQLKKGDVSSLKGLAQQWQAQLAYGSAGINDGYTKQALAVAQKVLDEHDAKNKKPTDYNATVPEPPGEDWTNTQSNIYAKTTNPHMTLDAKIDWLKGKLEDGYNHTPNEEYAKAVLAHLEEEKAKQAPAAAEEPAPAPEGANDLKAKLATPPEPDNAHMQSAYEIASDPNMGPNEKMGALQEMADDNALPPKVKQYAQDLFETIDDHTLTETKKQIEAEGMAAEAAAAEAEEKLPDPKDPLPTPSDSDPDQATLHEAANDPNESFETKVNFLEEADDAQFSPETAAYKNKLLAHLKAKMYDQAANGQAAEAPASVKAAEPEAPAAEAWKPEGQEHVNFITKNLKGKSPEEKVKELAGWANSWQPMAQKEYAAKLHQEMTGKFPEVSYYITKQDPVLGIKVPDPVTPGQIEAKGLLVSPTTPLSYKMNKLAEMTKSPAIYSPDTIAYAHDALEKLAKIQGTGGPKPQKSWFKGTTKFKDKVEQLGLQYETLKSDHSKFGVLASLSALANQGSNEGNKAYAEQMYEHLMKGSEKHQVGDLGAKPNVASTAAPKPTPAAPAHKLSEADKTEFQTFKSHWDKILPQNKPPVEAMQKALEDAFAKPTAEEQAEAVKAIKAIDNPQGMGQQSANQFLDKVKQKYGVAEKGEQHPHVGVASSTLPTGASQKLQDAIYHKAKDAPPKYVETVHKLQDAKGNKVKAKFVADTENIPDDFYAKVTAAYGNEHNGMTQAVDNAMLKYADKVQDRLTGAQKSALSSYQGSGYHAINDALRDKATPTASTQKIINDIKAAINSNYVPADTPVYRGLNASLKSLTGFDDPQQAVGRTFEHKNFASVSRSQQTAAGFGTQTMLHFTVPAGTPGIVMPKQNWEREIVLNARSMFKVDKVEQKVINGHTRHIVHCTYLGTRED